jgi:tRNA(His) guanylyltransferase
VGAVERGRGELIMDLGDRMKAYENVWRFYLPIRMPLIIRVDGKAFHTFTRKCAKPFDGTLANTMIVAAQGLLQEVQNSRMAYVQSDEISILLVDYDNFNTEQWFGGNLQKVVSVSASIATAIFNVEWNKYHNDVTAMFDSRAFVLPREEVTNYFIWRQQDATRNSIEVVGQAHFSHKQLHKKNCGDIQEMLFKEKCINWNNLPTWQKRGAVVTKEDTDGEIPIFTQDREYIERYLEPKTQE